MAIAGCTTVVKYWISMLSDLPTYREYVSVGHSNGWFLSCRDAVPKQCCGLGSPPVRWSILGVGVVGLVCAGAGALLGALRASGRDHIAVALLMIGKNILIFFFLSYY